MNNIDFLREVFKRVHNLKYKDISELDDIVRKGEMILGKMFPGKFYNIEIKSIQLIKAHYYEPSMSVLKQEWEEGKNKIINLLDTAIKDYELQQKPVVTIPIKPVPITLPQNKVIIKEKIVKVPDEAGIEIIRRELNSYKKKVKNWSYCIGLSVVISLVLWCLYFFSYWDWYNQHEKKLSITLTSNLTIILFLLYVPIRNSGLIIAAAIAGLYAVFTSV